MKDQELKSNRDTRLLFANRKEQDILGLDSEPLFNKRMNDFSGILLNEDSSEMNEKELPVNIVISSKYERLIKLADEVFAVKNDPSQLDVNPQVLERLHQIHPATVSQQDEDDGPVAWVLIFPTTLDLMHRFLESGITERELFNLTPLHTSYEAIYLCSALVLEEYQRKGITKTLALNAIERIRENHPLKVAFVWAFSPEGDLAAETIARLAGLPLYKREK